MKVYFDPILGKLRRNDLKEAIAYFNSMGVYAIITVANYSALPAPNTVSGYMYVVLNSQGTQWLPGSLGGTYYPKGFYYSDGTQWIYAENPYQATQAAVNAGLIDNQFVTPFTLKNASQWTTKADVANNLSDLTSKANARVNLEIDKRTTFGNANYTVLVTDKEIVTSVAFTAPRTVTLPTGVNAGKAIIIIDEFQTVTSVNTLTIAVPTGKKLNGILNGTEVISSAGGSRILYADGSDNFVFDAGIVRNNRVQNSLAADGTGNKIVTVDAINAGVQTKQVIQITSSTAPTISTTGFRRTFVDITAQASNINLGTNLSGTPQNGDVLWFQIKPTSSGYTIATTSVFENKGQAIPTNLTLSKRTNIGFTWDSTTSKWGCIAQSTEA